jgi:hypothetical protein
LRRNSFRYPTVVPESDKTGGFAKKFEVIRRGGQGEPDKTLCFSPNLAANLFAAGPEPDKT